MDFAAAAQVPFQPSAAWADALYRQSVMDDDRIAIVRDGGVLLGVVGASPMGPFLQSHEVAWWVDPAHRGGSVAMLDMYEDWARRMGAKLISAASLAIMPEVEAIYRSRGYQRLESHWVKAS